MKLNQIITGCALAAGLIAFAPLSSQASNPFFDGYPIPLNFKASYSYISVTDGKIHKATITNKDILNYINENFYSVPTGSKLYFYDGDVYIVTSKGEPVADLSEDDGADFGFEIDELYSTTSEGENYESYYSSGDVYLYLGSDGHGPLGENQFSIEAEGTYKFIAVETEKRNGYYTDTESFTSSNLSGEGYDDSLSYDTPLPVTATVSASYTETYKN